MEDDKNNIKKIDEFLNVDGVFPFGELQGDFTDEELRERKEKREEAVRRNIEELGIKSSNSRHLMNIEGFRETIRIRTKMGRQLQTNEELDEYCIKRFGEPFFKNDDDK